MRVYSLPMRTRFRGITVREGVLIRGAGRLGGVEPVPGVRRRPSPSRGCAAPRRPPPATGRRRCATRVPVNVTVPAVGPEQAHAIVLRGGCRTAKVKVAEPGQTLADDQARLEAVRDAIGPDGRIRIDVNGLWDVDTAVAAIAVLDRAAGGLEYVEQPVASVEDLAVVRRAVGVPIAADESIRRAADPYRVRDLEAADVAVLKVQPLGGVRACLRIAEDIGLPVVVSSALETVDRDRGRASRWRPRCPSCPTPAGSRPCSCSSADVVDGVAAAGRRGAAGAAAGRRRVAACTREPDRVAHWEARLAEVRAAAAGSSAVTSTDTRARRRDRADRGRRHRDRGRARARATRRSPSRRTTPPRPAWSGCTPASTSAPPASSRSG